MWSRYSAQGYLSKKKKNFPSVKSKANVHSGSIHSSNKSGSDPLSHVEMLKGPCIRMTVRLKIS